LDRTLRAFSIHPRLEADCHRLGRLALSHVLLHRNAALPWLILVPEVDVIELCDLAPRERTVLDAEIDRVCALIRSRFAHITKLNVAAIGNLVPQLHVHVIGRHPGDACWPGVVWGNLHAGGAWPEQQLRELGAALAATPA